MAGGGVEITPTGQRNKFNLGNERSDSTTPPLPRSRSNAFSHTLSHTSRINFEPATGRPLITGDRTKIQVREGETEQLLVSPKIASETQPLIAD